MYLDRMKQLAMLNALATVYPRYTADVVEGEITEDDLANLWYLKEQGLVDGALDMSISQTYIFQGVRINARALTSLQTTAELELYLELSQSVYTPTP